MAKLWQKDYQLNALVEAFTVGLDPELDQRLVAADAVASMAQARQLVRIGLLTPDEGEALVQELRALVRDWSTGAFVVTRADEDCHTAIENRLTEKLGDVGKKIHTGRSRNDQVQTALRVYGRSRLLSLRLGVVSLAKRIAGFARTHQQVPMPGRTHMQSGMPSSVGLWAAAWAEELTDVLLLADAVGLLWDQSPLGAAAGYGVPLPLDREYSASLLGFSKVQNNVIYVNNSRGKFEAAVLDVADQLGLTLSKIAQDLILFSLPEFGYFRLPPALCTGSSIMPQKKNPDGLELVRAKSGSLSAWSAQVKSIIRSLPSGYNRDFQETKEPLLRGLDTSGDLLALMELTFEQLEVVPERLVAGFTPDIFATDAAYELVRQGWSFRDAYREVGLNLQRLNQRDPVASIANRTHTGSAGNLKLEPLEDRLMVLTRSYTAESERIATALESLVGREVWEVCRL
ncbi:MAG: argininosuccinate lyase [Spirochaetales bacterium]